MKVITAILSCVAISVAAAESRHPCVYFRADELPSLREKAKDVAWAREIVARWHREVDSAVLRHADDPSFAPSRLQMNWTEDFLGTGPKKIARKCCYPAILTR